MDKTFKQLRADGVGCNSKHTENLNKEEENTLWESGALGSSTPKLCYELFFYLLNGKNFAYVNAQSTGTSDYLNCDATTIM